MAWKPHPSTFPIDRGKHVIRLENSGLCVYRAVYENRQHGYLYVSVNGQNRKVHLDLNGGMWVKHGPNHLKPHGALPYHA